MTAKCKERWQAMAEGKSTYFTGKPCKHGHICERQTDNKTCLECSRASNIKHYWKFPEKRRAALKLSRERHPDVRAAIQMKRHALELKATVAWADYEKIQDLYRESRRLTDLTGILHHVDHIVPLQGKSVCGLHVHYNMRVITAEENMKKHNKVFDELFD